MLCLFFGWTPDKWLVWLNQRFVEKFQASKWLLKNKQSLAELDIFVCTTEAVSLLIA